MSKKRKHKNSKRENTNKERPYITTQLIKDLINSSKPKQK